MTYHLGNLYEKFRIPADGDSRRARRADEAIRRGAVSRPELGLDPPAGDR